MKLRIAVVINVIPSYREGFYNSLFIREDVEITIFCQDRIPGMNLKSIHGKYPDHVRMVRHMTASGEKIAWQFLPLRKIFKDFDVVFVEGNPRNLSHALLATLLRVFRKKVVLWTMAHSFWANMITENIRLRWSRIFKFLFVYTDHEVEYLRARGFHDQVIIGMNNGLNQTAIDSIAAQWTTAKLHAWKVEKGFDRRRIILSSARLVQKNRYDLLIRALPSVIQRVPDLIWCIIGTGDQKDNLAALAKEIDVQNHLLFVGEVYDEDKIAPYFLSADCLVHPEGIGLSVLHAFGYGLPVITHGNGQLHGPEYAAFQNNETGYNYEQGNVVDLGNKIIALLQNDIERSKMRIAVKNIVREKYNVDVMASRFIEIAKLAYNS